MWCSCVRCCKSLSSMYLQWKGTALEWKNVLCVNGPSVRYWTCSDLHPNPTVSSQSSDLKHRQSRMVKYTSYSLHLRQTLSMLFIYSRDLLTALVNTSLSIWKKALMNPAPPQHSETGTEITNWSHSYSCYFGRKSCCCFSPSHPGCRALLSGPAPAFPLVQECRSHWAQLQPQVNAANWGLQDD